MEKENEQRNINLSTPRLTSSSLGRSLDAIWRRGDRDEVSIKHIRHAIAALCTGLNWDQGGDYSLNGMVESGLFSKHWDQHGEHVPSPGFNAVQTQKLTLDLSGRWDRIQKHRDKVGKEEFERIFMKTNYGYRDLEWEKSCISITVTDTN